MIRSVFLRLVAFILIDLALVSIHSIFGIIYLLMGQPCGKMMGERVVVLIHGTGVSDWEFLAAKFYLFVMGIPFWSVKYDYRQAIRKSCDDVTKQIEKLKGDSGCNGVVLIGHSQGGLIAANTVRSKISLMKNYPKKVSDSM